MLKNNSTTSIKCNSAASGKFNSFAYYSGMNKNEKPRKPLEKWQKDDAARLKALFLLKKKEKKFTQESFGADFNIGNQGMVWQYLNGVSPLNLDSLIKFAKGLDVKPSEISQTLAKKLNFLENESQYPDNSDRFTLLEKRAEYRQENILDLPIMTVKQLAHGETTNNDNRISIARSWATQNLKGLTDTDNLAIVMADTNVMEPTFFHGDLLAVDKGVTQFYKEGIYVIDDGDTPSIKRVQKMTSGQMVLICDNRLFAPEFFTKEDFEKKISVRGKVLCSWKWNVF